ncbi:MAG: LPP20 family lipoprotein, partial [Deltaproteobacteria bacterium]|nr:LPP20 family lipoprotein [Deltaproteobacteria bacterium]
QAPWVSHRPIDSGYYIGIGSCDKKAHADDFRLMAENEALFDLSSEISVNISGSFMEKTMERTGLSAQDIRMEIQTTSKARLQGHQMVDEWEDRKRYWVYFRLSKKEYTQMQQRERERARAASLDMLQKAFAEKEKGQFISALRFYFEALSRIQYFIGDNLQANLQGSEVFLYNEIYAGIQRILADISLSADRERMPGLDGRPLADPLVVRGMVKSPAGAQALANMPVRYATPWRENDPYYVTTTDENGAARYAMPIVTGVDHGKSVKVVMDVDSLAPQVKPGAFFNAILSKVNIPQTSIALNIYNDEGTFRWRREFEGRKVVVLSAYEAGQSKDQWYKIHDELTNFIQEMGGTLVPADNMPGTAQIVRFSQTPGQTWDVTVSEVVDLVFVMAARGKLNRRENAKNPFGEDVQFAGEIRTAAQKKGKVYFQDRYRGAGGWNPMGAEMAMDVLALHVFKRWKAQYYKNMGQGPQ